MFSNIQRCSLKSNTVSSIKRTKRSGTKPSQFEEWQTQNTINEMLQRRSNTSNNGELLKHTNKETANENTTYKYVFSDIPINHSESPFDKHYY